MSHENMPFSFFLTNYCGSLNFLFISPFLLPVKYYSLVQKLGNHVGSWQFKIAGFIHKEYGWVYEGFSSNILECRSSKLVES